MRHFIRCVEGEKVGLRDFDGPHCFTHGREQVLLSKDELCFGDLECVREFVGRVGRVGAGKDTASADDGENKNRVGDAIERVDANAIARLETGMA